MDTLTTIACANLDDAIEQAHEHIATKLNGDGWFFADADADEVSVYEGVQPDFVPALAEGSDHLDGLSDREVDRLYEQLDGYERVAVFAA